ncbi:hypothetical protein [Variovorax sp. dw_954]|uniref:phage tail fiber protein n=1 Tax=Variovorax sp. dw_954 TaxID=2720078 RepID=UPI001BD2AB72|nr:hypothetical protein [Variovorax sp. dw_954]
MSFNTTFANDLLKLILQATAIANLADNAATSPLTSVYLALHTADPGAAGTQSTNEISYTGYARVAVARTSGGWSISNNVANPVANIDFGEMTAGTGGTVTHVSVGVASSGATKILLRGTLTPNIVVANGVTPRVKTTSSLTLVTT